MVVKTNQASPSLHFVRKLSMRTAFLKFEVPFLLKVVIKKFLAQKWLSSTRYFGDLAKSLWQPLKIDFDTIFRSAIFL